MTFGLFEFVHVIYTTQSLIQYLRKNKLLKSKLVCCEQECTIIKDPKISDGEIFKCTLCKKKKSIRVDSFFTKSKLSLRVLFTVMYLFIKDLPLKTAYNFLDKDVSMKSMQQWFTYLREICSLYLNNVQQLTFGGDVSIVQMDESFIGHQPKYFRGAWRGQQYMLFGIIDTITKKCVIEFVPNKSHDSLLPIIKRYVPIGSTVHTDSMVSYDILGRLGYNHRTVNHTVEYVAFDGTHTNNIENLWVNMKSKFKSMRGTRESTMALHIDEFQYRWNRKKDGDIFELFIEDVARFYNVQNI